MKKVMFPLYPLNCGPGHRRTSALQGHLVKVKGSSPGECPMHSLSQIPPYTPIMHHSPCLPDIKPLSFKHSFTVSIHLFQGLLTETSSTHSYIDPFRNPVVLLSLHIVKPSENTTINLFVHTLRHFAQK